MEGKKPKWLRVGRLSRAALFLGVAGATAGGLVLSAGVAQAGVGSDPGGVSLSPASGSTTSSPTWSTNTPCPANFQGSAVFKIEEGGGNTFSISGAVASPTANIPATPLLDPINRIQSVAGLANGGTDELVVYCFSQGGEQGNSEPVMSTFLTISTDGTTYSTSSTPPAATPTSTTLTASPNPATTGGTITLTATVTDSDNTTPAGGVTFSVGGSPINTTPAAVSCTGTPAVCTATTTTTIAAAGTYNLTAVYNPNSTSYSSSTGNYSETVNPPTSPTTGSEPLAVTVPASGTFTLTVATGTVNLTVNGSSASGALNPVTVSDTRNTFPGWSVSGQESNFTGTGTAAGSSISGDQLGWVPTDTSLGTGVVLGGSVVAGTNPGGLGDTAAVLASATAPNGSGTSVLGANLTLAIPASAVAGPYGGIMTITAVTSLA